VTASEESKEMEKDDMRVIEVCTGPDCSLSGGPAGLWEIEELNLEFGCRFHIVAGGCRNLCTMGPNVHGSGVHFTKVKSAEDVERVAKEIGMFEDDGLEKKISSVSMMLTKKANRRRWIMLRNITTQSKRGLKKKTGWKKELEEVYRAEVRAAGRSEEPRQRANRRRERLGRMIDKL
jgi:(2Fe-2S) ferredoxin